MVCASLGNVDGLTKRKLGNSESSGTAACKRVTCIPLISSSTVKNPTSAVSDGIADTLYPHLFK